MVWRNMSLIIMIGYMMKSQNKPEEEGLEMDGYWSCKRYDITSRNLYVWFKIIFDEFYHFFLKDQNRWI
jgi:hypothetical protein